MEVKTLLRLIKDDIAHLDGITDDFFSESLLLSDEVELALVRAKALLRELELLLKFTVQHDNSSQLVKLNQELKVAVKEHENSEQVPLEHPEPEETKLADSENLHAEEIDEVKIDNSQTEEHLNALVEPSESMVEIEERPIVYEEKMDEPATNFDESAESNNDRSELIESVEETIIDVNVLTIEVSAVDETVISLDDQDHNEEIIAEEFREVKKTLNESLGEAHQMVNDILSPDISDSGYKIHPINSIWDGIGINDRFLFIRELFSNSSARFETTIAALDKLETIHDAVNYLKMNFKWNKSEASQKFLVLVKRRFTK